MAKQSKAKPKDAVDAKFAFLMSIKQGDYIILKTAGILGRETSPVLVTGATIQQILIRHDRFSRTDGLEIETRQRTKNDAGERVLEPSDPYRARILRRATPDDMEKAKQAQLMYDRAQQQIRERDAKMEALAALFPRESRPSVSPAWNGQTESYHLEFDDITEEQVKRMANLLRKELQ